MDYAYETRHKFPDRRLYLVGEIIHNPHVNQKLSDMGVRFLARGDDGQFDFSPIQPEDVVILPAFGVTVEDFERLRTVGCVLVDTTCGSVLNVWKRVESYARDGFTAVIHGKHYHEETKATASQVTRYPGGRYLVVLNMDEARRRLRLHRARRRRGGAGGAVRPGGVAGVRLRARTWSGWGSPTRPRCSSGESLAIAEEIRRQHGAPLRRGGAGASTSARSTRSAPPPRSGRTRWWRCWTGRST